VLAQLEEARGEIARHLAEADPDRVTTSRAVEVMALFAEIERLGSAGKILFTRRASQGTAWRDEGHRSAASWMAQKTGTGLGDAMATLETAEALTALPQTTEALRRGELSGPQVKVIAAAAASHPDQEKELLVTAGTDSFKALKQRAAAVRATAGSEQEENARYWAIHAARYVRHWADPDGAFRLDAKLTPDAGARLLSSLQKEADARFTLARKAKTEENPAAYQADALVALATGETLASGSSGSDRSGSGRATVCIRVDGTALERGFTKSGEICHIPGVGPVPVATVRRQLADAHVKILVREGKDVTTVCHAGRTVTAHVQSALEERDPSCVVPGCDVAQGLENHHWDIDYVTCRTTSLAGLARVCHWHHGLLSYGGYTLEGESGAWVMRGPPGGDRFETLSPLLDSG
jgi:hypothetical protein